MRSDELIEMVEGRDQGRSNILVSIQQLTPLELLEICGCCEICGISQKLRWAFSRCVASPCHCDNFQQPRPILQCWDRLNTPGPPSFIAVACILNSGDAKSDPTKSQSPVRADACPGVLQLRQSFLAGSSADPLNPKP